MITLQDERPATFDDRADFEAWKSLFPEATDKYTRVQTQWDIIEIREKAILVEAVIHSGRCPRQWLPKSVIGVIDDKHFGFSFCVKTWFLAKNNLWKIVK